jgi:Zn-finger nucleic acid-binding protein
METRQAGATSVHVCVTCKGLWIDWFDGEASVVAQLAGQLSIPRAPIAAIQRATCPDCRSALTLQPYGPGGPALWRCSECAGTFVPRGSFEALVHLEAAADEPPSPLHTLVGVITQILDAILP